MKAIIIALFATAFSFLFLNKPFVSAVGGTTKLWKVLAFDLFIGVCTYSLVRCF